MRSSLQAILAVYLGIYLVLPACLCQALCIVGAGPEASDDDTGPRIVCNDVAPQICHCHDHESKVAEVAPTQDEVRAFALLSASRFTLRIPRSVAGDGPNFQPRPPPGHPDSPSTRTARLGVFLV